MAVAESAREHHETGTFPDSRDHHGSGGSCRAGRSSGSLGRRRRPGGPALGQQERSSTAVVSRAGRSLACSPASTRSPISRVACCGKPRLPIRRLPAVQSLSSRRSAPGLPTATTTEPCGRCLPLWASTPRAWRRTVDHGQVVLRRHRRSPGLCGLHRRWPGSADLGTATAQRGRPARAVTTGPPRGPLPAVSRCRECLSRGRAPDRRGPRPPKPHPIRPLASRFRRFGRRGR